MLVRMHTRTPGRGHLIPVAASIIRPPEGNTQDILARRIERIHLDFGKIPAKTSEGSAQVSNTKRRPAVAAIEGLIETPQASFC